MNNLIGKRKGICFIMTLFVGIIITSVIFSGCEPLRKKFTRQKKKAAEDSDIIPVLEPIDYPVPNETAEDKYRQHYSLWNVWSKDLVNALDDNSSDRRLIYILDQMMIQLEQMQLLITEEQRSMLEQYRKNLLKIKEQFAQPAELRNNFVIKSKVTGLSRDIRQNYSFEKVKESLLGP